MLLGMRASAVICAIVICGCGSNADRVPTWHRDVRPIVTQSCSGCHSTGSIAPFPFESYADLFGRQQLIREQVTSRRMPPWPPAPGCTEYDDDRSLSEKDRTTLLTWLDHGAPEGNPADATPVSSPPPGGLSRIDRERYDVTRAAEWPADPVTSRYAQLRNPSLAYVHSSKLDGSLIRQLQMARLAEEHNENGHLWVGMHPRLAQVYMAALAEEAARVNTFSPTTPEPVGCVALGVSLFG